MTTQNEMKVIAKNVIKELSEIENYMTRYNKLRGIAPVEWGAVQLDAYEFLQNVREEIKKINQALGAFTRPDLQCIYANRNFDDYVSELRKTLEKMQKRFKNLKKVEDLPYLYPPSDEDDD